MIVFLSNRLPILLQHLKEGLFPDGSTDPFKERLLIVPSSAMESWVRRQLADELGICAGVRTLFLQQAVAELSETTFPSPLELTLQIEARLDAIPEVASYLAGKSKRRLPLAKQLATLFIRYALYGQRVKKEGWQWDLWKELFPDWRFEFPPCRDSRVHLFGFSHLSRLHLTLFMQLSEAFLYHLSPCQEFWCDDLNVEGAPLLSHLGGVGRAFSRMILEADLPTVESYAPPGETSLLTTLQTDLLDLREETSCVDDGTIEIHQCPSPRREVERLYHTLRTGPYAPGEVIVMAPDITLYAPYIQALFRDIEAQITDLPVEPGPLSRLLDLETKRWNAPALLDLAPLFGWDRSQVTRWLDMAEIRWGFDADHRRHLVGHPTEEEGACQPGFTELLRLLAATEEVPMTEAEALGEWIRTVQTLYTYTRPFYDGALRSAATWASLLYRLSSLLPEPVEMGQIERLVKAAPDRDYPFSTLRPLIEEEITTTLHGNQLQAVRFCSMLPMRAIPARLICLMGMNDDAFPRSERLQALDCLHDAPGSDYVPSRLDFDRALFLDALLSAKEKLVISYSGEAPTPLLELLPTKTHIVHPDDSFDPRYFDGSLPSGAAKDYEAALAAVGQSAATWAPSAPAILPAHTVDLADLMRFVRSPLKVALKRLDISFFEQPPLPETEELTLSPLTLAQVRRDKLPKALPLGAFRPLAERRMAEQPRRSPLSFELPPTKIGSTTLMGTVEGGEPGRLEVLEKSDVRGAVHSLPALLALNLFAPTTLHFLRDGEQKSPFFADPRAYLERLLELYHTDQPTPLIPDLIAPLAAGDAHALAKQIEASFDEGLAWMRRAHKLPPPETLIAEWQEKAQTLYGEMLDAWF